ncbi:MAG: hypothetical protein ACI4GY_04590 [Acutalibacteraceae bacterium]
MDLTKYPRIRHLYSDLVCSDEYSEMPIVKDTEEDIKEAIDKILCYSKSAGKDSKRKFDDEIYKISAINEETGFVLGFIYAFGLSSEAMKEGENIE